LGNNLTFYTLNIKSLGSTSSNGYLYFSDGATINVVTVLSYGGSGSGNGVRRIITSNFSTGFTLNKIGGGCGYFANTRLATVTGTPTNAWFANTVNGASPGSMPFDNQNSANFGNNTDGGGNSGIVFNQYPALGGFNEFF
jgi:hypothetical protein